MGIPSGKHQSPERASDIAIRLRNALDGLQTRGSTACSGETPFEDPEIYLPNADYAVELPLRIIDAMAISQSCIKPAKSVIKVPREEEHSMWGDYTMSTKPKITHQVATRWNLDAGEFHIRSTSWETCLRSVVDDAGSTLVIFRSDRICTYTHRPGARRIYPKILSVHLQFPALTIRTD